MMMRSQSLLVGTDGEVVDEHALQALRGERKYSGSSVLVEFFLTHFDGPFFRLGFSALPKFRAHKPTAAGLVGVHASLQSVPRVRLRVEGHGLLHAFVIAGNFEDAAV